MSESPERNLQSDPLLRDAPTCRGFKVLEPAVLYAKVGQGGMGAVYRGRHFKLDIDVAVKCLRPSLAEESPEFVARFEREARLAAQLTHQNVVNVMDVHQKHGLHYLVMEFVTGEDARARVLRKGKLGEQEALAILLGAATGLAEAHARGIVHRDIKPDNVLVSLRGRVKLADLGLAKAQQSSGQSMSLASGVMGTPQYMPPEQWDSPDVGASADVWALGATLYYLLVGEHAIDGATIPAMARKVQDQDFPSLRDARPGLRDEVYSMFERCVARKPAERFSDARELLQVLRPLVQIDETALADAESAARSEQEGLVSPPPRQTLMTIRAELESAVVEQRENGGDGGRDAFDHEALTVVAPEHQSGQRPEYLPEDPPETLADGGSEFFRNKGDDAPVAAKGRAGRKAMIALLVAGAGILVAWLAGAFDDSVDWPKVEREVRAKELYWEGKRLLPLPDGLDKAIEKFEECLKLMPEHQLVREPLGMALDKRAEKLVDTDLDAAFVASDRAHELYGKDDGITERFQAIVQKLRQRLFAGLEIRSPSGSDIQRSAYLVAPSNKFELRGRIRSKGFKTLQVQVPTGQIEKGVSVMQWRPVSVVGGEFVVPIEAPIVGDAALKIAMTDAYGIQGTITRTLRCAGIAGIRIVLKGVPLSTHFNAAGCRMRPLKAAKFNMGSSALQTERDRDEPLHAVTLSDRLWMADTEVTRAQWRRVMGTEVWPDPEAVTSLDLPVANVTYDQAIAFCRKLTELERQAGRLPNGFVYTLPTEAQWEYAASGDVVKRILGSKTEGGAPKMIHGTDGPGNVAQTRANEYLLYDMLGNVAEWCRDFATKVDGTNIRTVTKGDTDPIGTDGDLAVVRGGAWNSPKKECRTAARDARTRTQASPSIGFRPALVRR